MFDPIERYANVMLALVSPVRRGREQLHRFAHLLISGYHAPPPTPARTRRRTWLSLTDPSAVLARATLSNLDAQHLPGGEKRNPSPNYFSSLEIRWRRQLNEFTARCQSIVYRQTLNSASGALVVRDRRSEHAFDSQIRT
jgi:hypothetical protein